MGRYRMQYGKTVINKVGYVTWIKLIIYHWEGIKLDNKGDLTTIVSIFGTVFCVGAGHVAWIYELLHSVCHSLYVG